MKVLLLLIVCQVLSQSCLNHEGEEVEWWVILNMKIDNDLNYLYCDSESCKELEYVEGRQINDEMSPLSQTMKNIDLKNGPSSTMNVIWSDKQPFQSAQDQQRAHSKGILQASWEKQYGFVISHSMPEFPLIDDKTLELKFGENVGSKAEHFFCVTLDIQDIEEMAELYSLAKINTYKKQNEQVDKQFQEDYPNIYNLKAANPMNSDNNKSLIVQTDGHSNLVVILFAINQKFDQDIYEYIMEELDIGLITETGNVKKREPQEFQGHILVNNQRIHYDKNEKKINFNSNEDHSKYAISDNEKKPFVCFLDMGLKSRRPKAGTGLCFRHKHLWKDIQKSFVEIQKETDLPKQRTKRRHEEDVHESSEPDRKSRRKED